jgi:hypothetical protein
MVYHGTICTMDFSCCEVESYRLYDLQFVVSYGHLQKLKKLKLRLVRRMAIPLEKNE